MNTTNDRIIIGIDPGTNVMGYGVLRIVGNTPELMTLGVIQFTICDYVAFSSGS